MKKEYNGGKAYAEFLKLFFKGKNGYCNMEDDITVQIFSLPNGIDYTAKLDNHLHFDEDV